MDIEERMAHGISGMEIDESGKFMAIDFRLYEPEETTLRVLLPAQQLETVIAALSDARSAVAPESSPSRH